MWRIWVDLCVTTVESRRLAGDSRIAPTGDIDYVRKCSSVNSVDGLVAVWAIASPPIAAAVGGADRLQPWR